ncbi:MAG: hypothetical protein KDA84_29815, partial [Planctomycetaceae bacterium]|nr:hypothetical protein [Planctomycetaceae bacterium]
MWIVVIQSELPEATVISGIWLCLPAKVSFTSGAKAEQGPTAQLKAWRESGIFLRSFPTSIHRVGG